MDAITADTLAYLAIGVVAVAAVIAAIVRGHVHADVSITGEHRPGQITLIAGERIEVLSVTNEDDALGETLKREPLSLPFFLEPAEPFTLEYREIHGAAHPQKVRLLLRGDKVREVELPPLGAPESPARP
ncbi:hypothetical protein [Nesterenkonia sp. Act20]|uniref:hypothetical protein n=1 Tax=Nesterenkonia sp. Act20 TaxID=1483432 RepID=UPI001C43FB75|nr:hypothetical protein [Nesterenkonia sp. Act20]